jgi:hypothetical protein
MTRQLLIVVGVALLSAAGFGMILGIGWLVLHLVLGVVPYLLAARLRALQGVLPALFVLVAFVGAAWTASSISWHPKQDQSHPDLPTHS